VLTTGTRCFLVGGGEAVAGLVSQTDVTRLKRDAWAETTLGQAMVPAEDVHTTEPEASLADAAQLMQEHDVHQLPVVQDGRLLGMLTRADVMQQLELRQRFGQPLP
jgi:CBS domain-containing protein